MMDTLQDKDEIVFLYQLVKGRTSSSYACQVAAGVGLPPAVVARAEEVTNLASRNLPIPKAHSPLLDKQQGVYVRGRELCIGEGHFQPWV